MFFVLPILFSFCANLLRQNPSLASQITSRLPGHQKSDPPLLQDYYSYDHAAYQRLLEKITLLGDPHDMNSQRPLFSLEEFFEDNNDYGSIG